MDSLTDDALRHLFLRFDDPKSLVQSALVCRRWRAMVAPSSPFWITKCKRDGKLVPERLIAADTTEFENQVDYRLIWLKNPYGRNLIKNDSGQEWFKYWVIKPNYGTWDGTWDGGFVGNWNEDVWDVDETWEDGWGGEWNWDHSQVTADAARITMYPIESPPQMIDPMAGNMAIDCCFATSFFTCRKWQKIDLWAEGIEPWILNRIKPTIVVSEWHAGAIRCGSRYWIDVWLFQDGNEGTPVDTFHDSRTVQQGDGGHWEQSLHKFRGYPENVRYVVFRSSGQDTQTWAGFFGAKMAKASVTIEFE